MKLFNIDIKNSLLPVLAMVTLTIGTHAYGETVVNGIAHHSELGADKFIAAIYTQTPSSSAKALLEEKGEQKMELRIVDDAISARQFNRMWVEGIAINATADELKKHQKAMAQFSKLVKVRFKQNDVISLHKTQTALRVSVNGVELGKLNSPEFFPLVMRTWIGDVPLSTGFKTALLSSGNVSPDVAAHYESIQPTKQRTAAFEQAVAQREAAREKARLAALATPTPKPKPAPVRPKVKAPVVVAATPKPTPKPQVAQLLRPESLDESIFAEEEWEIDSTENLLNEQIFYSQLANYTQSYIEYPKRAKKKGYEGTLMVLG